MTTTRTCRPRGTHFYLLLASLAYALTCRAEGSTWYVDGTVGQDANPGTSWPAAFRTLQKALSVAQSTPPDTIYVATGTYLPLDGLVNPPPDPKSATFSLKANVAVHGGFP